MDPTFVVSPFDKKPDASPTRNVRDITIPPKWGNAAKEENKKTTPSDAYSGQPSVFKSQPSLQGYSSNGSAGGPITCEKFLMISKGMTDKVFKNLDDFFLGP